MNKIEKRKRLASLINKGELDKIATFEIVPEDLPYILKGHESISVRILVGLRKELLKIKLNDWKGILLCISDDFEALTNLISFMYKYVEVDFLKVAIDLNIDFKNLKYVSNAGVLAFDSGDQYNLNFYKITKQDFSSLKEALINENVGEASQIIHVEVVDEEGSYGTWRYYPDTPDYLKDKLRTN